MELWDAYYPDGTKAGIDLKRGEPIPPEYRHAVTEILVLHQDGSVLLTQRDHRKEIHPGWWESSAGGSVRKGESVPDGARRELMEETGIRPVSMEELYRDVTGDTIYTGFLAVTDIEKNEVRLQAGETIAFQWAAPDAFIKITRSGTYGSNSRGQLDAVIRDRVSHNFTSLPVSDAGEIRAQYTAMYDAMIAKDAASLSEVLDDSFVLVHMTGMKQSKLVFIRAVLDGTLNYFSAKHQRMDVTVDGDTATLVGQSYVAAAVFGGGRHNWHLQQTLTLTKKKDAWRITKSVASTY